MDGMFEMMCVQAYNSLEMNSVRTLVNLKSEVGKKLCGTRVKLVGKDDFDFANLLNLRTHVEKPDGKIIRVRHQNIIEPNKHCSVVSRPMISDDKLYLLLADLLQHGEAEGFDEPIVGSNVRDKKSRYQFLRKHIDSGTGVPVSVCKASLATGPESDFERTVRFISPACRGNEEVDFHRFGEGLLAYGNSPCSICLETISVIADVVTLPCRHMFHLECGTKWFIHHDCCPDCRNELSIPWQNYCHRQSDQSAWNQITVRLREWMVSGMCERCQADIHERDPFIAVSVGEEGACTLVPMSKLTGDMKITTL